MLNKLIKKICEQQKGKNDSSPAYCVGEQIKEICERQPRYAEIVLTDLELPEMSIDKVADKLQEYADKNHKKPGAFCITPKIAEGIIRKFYGIEEAIEQVDIEEVPLCPTLEHVNLEDFFDED